MPVHEPEASHDVASVDDQVSVKLSQDVTAALSVSKLTVGAAGAVGGSGFATGGGGSGVTPAPLPEPPPPQPDKSREPAAAATISVNLIILIKYPLFVCWYK